MYGIRIIFRNKLLFYIIIFTLYYFFEDKLFSSFKKQIKIHSSSILSTLSAPSVQSSTFLSRTTLINDSISVVASNAIFSGRISIESKNSASEIIETIKLKESLYPYGSYFDDDSGCKLPKLDPWDPSVLPFIDRNFHPMKDCKPTAEALTILENGTLRLTPNSESQLCWYRCLLPDTDHDMKMDEWKFLNISAIPNCDILETQCNTTGTVTYRRMHIQVVPLPNVTAAKNISEPFQPSVLILLFDAASRSTGLRSMPETLKVLTDDYGAFDFHNLNKVGHNSAPNGYAFLNGIRIEDLPSIDFHVDEKLPSEMPDYCKERLDNSTFIGRNFSSAGYVSLMAEDYDYGVFNWPSCQGFKRKPVTHYIRPFQLRLWRNKYADQMMKDQMIKQQCQESYQPVMEYLKQFLKAYPTSVPKFSLTWITELAHSNMNGLFHVDKYFADFFREYRQSLRESFVFVMADHGLNFREIRNTKIGKIENGNPLLFVALPESLTSNKQLMNNMRINSAERLISHFDIYTTLLDIAAIAPRTNWTDFGVYNWSEKEGLNPRQSSILRPLDPKRTCNFMHISESYCICDVDEMEIPSDSQIAIDAAIFVNKEVMKNIAGRNASEICADLSVKNVTKAYMRRMSNKEKSYRVTYVTSPNNGIFQADVKPLEKGFLLLSDSIARINAFGRTSNCTKDEDIIGYCFCLTFL